MSGGFFNRIYYGNPKKPDLKKEDVKGNRIKLFFTVLSVRFWQLIQLNLLYSLFWIPTYLLLLARAFIYQDTGQALDVSFYLFLIPCLVIAGPATAGITYVIRNWARDEHAWVWSDFKDAWKENWKQGLLMMLINGIFLYVISISMEFYKLNAANNIVFVFLNYMLFVTEIIFIMLNMFAFLLMVTYRLSLIQIIKNSFLLTMIKLPLNFLIFLFAAALTYVSLFFFRSIPFFVLGLTLPALIVISYANWILDKYMNNRNTDEETIAPENEQ